MHVHFSATAALSAFFSVLILGTLWRLLASYLVAMSSPTMNNIGKAMAFQY